MERAKSSLPPSPTAPNKVSGPFRLSALSHSQLCVEKSAGKSIAPSLEAAGPARLSLDVAPERTERARNCRTAALEAASEALRLHLSAWQVCVCVSA